MFKVNNKDTRAAPLGLFWCLFSVVSVVNFEWVNCSWDERIQNFVKHLDGQKQPPELFCKKLFLKTSQNSQENTCARVSFSIKLQASGLRPATLLKKRLWHTCFPVNFVKFLRTPFYRKPPGDCFWIWRGMVDLK